MTGSIGKDSMIYSNGGKTEMNGKIGGNSIFACSDNKIVVPKRADGVEGKIKLCTGTYRHDGIHVSDNLADKIDYNHSNNDDIYKESEDGNLLWIGAH